MLRMVLIVALKESRVETGAVFPAGFPLGMIILGSLQPVSSDSRGHSSGHRPAQLHAG